MTGKIALMAISFTAICAHLPEAICVAHHVFIIAIL